MKRTPLRRKRKGPDPIGALYGKEVTLRRKEWNMRAGEYDPHHPQGRHGVNLLFFVMIDRSLHARIHKFPNIARLNGWLANINGSYTREQPLVVRARQRQAELIQLLAPVSP